jgi:two-component system chemotaxis sensor kinase CheA
MANPIQSHSEALAKAIVLSDPTREPAAFSAPIEGLASLARENSWENLGALCQRASESLSAMGAPGVDANQVLDGLEQVVIECGRIAEALARGESPSTPSAKPAAQPAAQPGTQAPRGESRGLLADVEPELLELFNASASENLAGIEQNLIELETKPQRADLWAELRRQVHTLKGECGVLSLSEVQGVLHEAESYLDLVSGQGEAGRLEPLFPLVDWLRRVLVCIASGSANMPDGSKKLLESFRLDGRSGNRGGPAGEASKAAPKPSPQAGTTSNASPAPASKAPANAPSKPAPASTQASRAGAAPSRAPARIVQSDDDGGPPVTFPPEQLQDDTLPDFINEAKQHIEQAEAGLLALESQPDDPEPLNVVFRAFHTIKGVAGFLNLAPIVRLAHSTETLMDEARKGRQLFTPAHIGLILAANDLMSRLLGALSGETAPGQGELNRLIERLDDATNGHIELPTKQAAPLEQVLEAIGIKSAEEMTAATRDSEKTVKRLGDILIERTKLNLQDLQFALSRQERLRSEGKAIKLGDLLVELGLITREQLNEALLAQGHSSPVVKLLESSTTSPPMDSEVVRKMRVENTVMVATHRLDMLVDMVGELVIAQQMIMQDPQLTGFRSETLSRNLAQVTKITRDLQEASMSLRMVTFKSTFQKMSRLVRDVAAKSGKDVALTMTGADTEVDRTVVEKISDPLIHILRNAIDHGLEAPQERIQSGKAGKGQLELRAYTKSGSILIEVRDDGRGIRREKILAKALSVGLINESQRPNEWSDNEVFKLIFAPGFSTAEKVTDISGRGVGMDVVKRNVEGMRGKIEIASTPGKGSTFTLKLPLTLAIIDGMIVRAGSDRYVLPTLSIVQSFRPTAETLHRVMSTGELIEVRGKLVPVFPLVRALHSGATSKTRAGDGILILLESAGGQVCVLVDAIVGQQQVVIKSLGKSLPSIDGISGGAILGDGRVALIVDVERLISNLTMVVA